MTKMIRRRTAIATTLAAGALAAPMLARHGWAQGAYPGGKTVRVVVPFAPGGTTDILARGVAQLLTNGQDVRAVPQILVDHVGNGAVAGIPVLVVIALAVALVAGIILHRTRFGRWVFAVGSSSEAARRSGVPLRAQIIKVYAIAGGLAGLAAVMSVARFSTTTIGGHTADNLATISAVVLGGTSLFGGIGSILGTVIGVFIPIVLLNGFVITGIPPFWQTVAMGAVLILAVYVDQLKRRNRILS